MIMVRLMATIFIALTFPTQSLFSQEQTKANIYRLLYSGQYDSVKTQLNELIKKDSSDAEIHFLFGMTYTFQNKRSEALKDFEQSYHLDSMNIKYLNYYANSLQNNGYFKKAAEENLSPEVSEFIKIRIRELTEAIFLNN